MRRLDKRYTIIPVILVVTVLAGFALRPTEPAGESITPDGDQNLRLLHQQFQQAVALLQHGQYDYAVKGFHEVLKVAPEMPEAHVNMGFALLGLQEFEAAKSFFDSATALKPEQSNAYYGLAIAHEGLGELPEAVAAMRAFTHVTEPDHQHRRKAESAIWEWEAELSGQRE